MTLREAIILAKEGKKKLTHYYFLPDEYITIDENEIVTFEDGMQIHLHAWILGKDYLLKGWSEYKK